MSQMHVIVSKRESQMHAGVTNYNVTNACRCHELECHKCMQVSRTRMSQMHVIVSKREVTGGTEGKGEPLGGCPHLVRLRVELLYP